MARERDSYVCDHDHGRQAARDRMALRWFAGWLPDADKYVVSERALARIAAWHATDEPRELLAGLPPLQKPVWYETASPVRGLVRGYGALPAADGGIDVGCASFSAVLNGMNPPLGPARVTAAGLQRPDHMGDKSWRELRSAAGVVLRALRRRG
jgi:hypothetical protein